MLHTPFQFDRPVFVKTKFRAANKDWNKGQHFPWLEMGVSKDRAFILYNNGFIQHHEEYTKKMKQIGDGLDSLGIEELHALVKKINEDVDKNTKNKTEARDKRCKKSAIVDKQRGLIRRWRSLYGELEST